MRPRGSSAASAPAALVAAGVLLLLLLGLPAGAGAGTTSPPCPPLGPAVERDLALAQWRRPEVVAFEGTVTARRDPSRTAAEWAARPRPPGGATASGRSRSSASCWARSTARPARWRCSVRSGS